MIVQLAPPVGLEQAVEFLEKTLSDAFGGNAGGNISAEQRDQILGWAALYQRVQRICDEMAKPDAVCLNISEMSD